ncbi:polysaccharide deacetylase family protein [Dethiothermospora halolimnae]|uniref:polysaccharide deacetylase family protein n=1 Tax=Dethiothermospora halolimnae TaxID=3114390 RepID=UPI003CCBE621
MIFIKLNKKIIILSLIITIFMYPKTIVTVINMGKDVYIARKLSIYKTKPKSPTTISNDKAKIIFMFDGGHKSIYRDVYKIMNKYNYKGNIPIIPSMIDDKEHLSYQQLSSLYLEGWNLLNQSYYHKKNMYDKCNELLLDFDKGKQWMDNRYLGKFSDMIVVPYGEINPYLIYQLKNSGYSNIRTSDNIIVLNSRKIQYLPVTTIHLLSSLTVNEVKDKLLEDYSKNNIFILVLNKIKYNNDEYYLSYSKKDFQSIIKFIYENNDKFQVITYSQLF